MDKVVHSLKEAIALANRADAMVVVGGRASANTRKLFEACRAICPRTCLVERASEIPPRFANIHTEYIGIAAGASTPDWSFKEVVTRMNDMERIDQETQQEPAAANDSQALTMEDIEKTVVRIRNGQTVTGTVVQITDGEVCVNIGYKSDGLIKKSELVDQNVKLGDEIEVEVVKVNDGEGNVLLSQRNIVIAALSLAIGVGFTQVAEIFSCFPELVQSVFAQNCVAVVFLVAVVANLVLPRDMEVKAAGSDGSSDPADDAAKGDQPAA